VASKETPPSHARGYRVLIVIPAVTIHAPWNHGRAGVPSVCKRDKVEKAAAKNDPRQHLDVGFHFFRSESPDITLLKERGTMLAKT
jgi:hypothetical protein